ncbi:MAG TPA: aldo/keto reductase [Ktedonobacterales bacterium]|nr:aldo/keto reductase [Ktedonobacterales bacterium]
MQQTTQQRPAEASGKLTIGGDRDVYRLGFGAMRITGPGIWGPPGDKQEVIRVLRRALELGINLIDTADSYGPEVSETLIAEALYPYPRGLVIATKGGLVRPGPDRWVPDGRPGHLRAALEGSLRRLHLDRIDVYQFHSPDPKVPFEESVGTLAEMQKEGKIRHIGLSNVTVDELARAQRIVPVVSVQNHYNLASRESEGMSVAESERMIDVCASQGIAFFPWAPLTAGALAQPVGPLGGIARQHHATPSQIALAWLLRRSPTMVPIPGTASVQHLEENVQGATIRLTDAELDIITRSSAGPQHSID